MAFFTNLLAMLRKPYYGNVPLFPAAQDMSWIPDAGTNIATQYAAEAPGGRVSAAGMTFTFVAAPKYVVYNGTLLKSGIDFITNGAVVTMLVPLAVGDELYGVV